jgi:hypothetical protein
MLRQASLYVAANVAIDPRKFAIRKADPLAIAEARRDAYQEAEPAIQTIARNNQYHAEIFYTIVNLLARPEICPLNPAALRSAFAETWSQVHVLRGFQRAEGAVRDLHYEYAAIGRIMKFIFSRKDVSEDFGARLARAAEKISERLQQARGKVIAAFANVPYPFENANGSVTVAEYAALISAQTENFTTASPFEKAGFEYDFTQTTLDRLATLYPKNRNDFEQEETEGTENQ